ncbi:pentatricopeptide repeat-containing protein At4g18975, chloroplastic-like isoform X3 [Triticum dicoccoides]|uniref:pentatricopeptide repeat-containing protein At4g18975, chloroplastic-like isoform X3 n=1 Tax=Triticum dicoccoides TaxID=85692 RepID=UPI00188F200D|nr:pentatricopeptide repeat-containing protein At4g18975, chloroplastic-like isoform X3 [Triticum dicoccoides]
MAAGPFALRLGPRLAAPAVASATRGGGRGSDRPTASRALVSKKSNKDHRLWIRKDSAGSGKKALCLVNTVTKWLMSKGQVLTWTMYDTLLLALSMDGRVDEAESIWNTILQTYTRSVPKKLFSRMIQIYNTRHLPDKVLEIYADMEELGVRPDEDTTRRIGRAFATSGQEDKQKPVLEKHLKKWKYIHFNGERVRVRRAGPLA